MNFKVQQGLDINMTFEAFRQQYFQNRKYFKLIAEEASTGYEKYFKKGFCTNWRFFDNEFKEKRIIKELLLQIMWIRI